MRCSICESSQVKHIDELLGTGASIREVARVTGLSRTTLGRHGKHRSPTSGGLALIPGDDDQDGPTDPLGEAFALAERARTPRERLRALEQIRAATKLALRGRTDLTQEDRDLLAKNIEDALAAYEASPDFETSARALAGWRESIAQRLDATDEDEPFAVNYPSLSFADGSPAMPRWLDNDYVDGDADDAERHETYIVPAARYWSGVPQRYRDRTRFVVSRRISLSLAVSIPQEIRVYKADGVLVWATPNV